MLAARNYRPVEISNVLCRPVERPTAEEQSSIQVRVVAPEEANLWSDISARGWSHEHPELGDFLLDLGAIAAAREDGVCFLAEHDGKPGAAGALCIHNGVALFGGSATIPELRRRGLHAALMQKRMAYACDHGCDLAMIVVQPGSESQRNAEREGFRIAYTRIKWQLCS
jgi:GNAT superfamily N-acetyltransferase